MELDPKEIRAGWKWFAFAGVVSICLCVFLYQIDRYMQEDNSGERLAETLKELRSAQGAVSSGVSDVRVLSPALIDLRETEN